jgi:aminopeptidase N
MADNGLFLVCIFICLTTVVLVQAVPVNTKQQQRNDDVRRSTRDVSDGRLPRRVFPTHYNLELKPDIFTAPEPPFELTGSVNIYITCELTTDHVVLNAKDLEYSLVAIIADPKSPVGTPSPILDTWSYDPSAEFLTLNVINALVPGAYYIIQIVFNGYLTQAEGGLVAGSGLYWDSYVDTDGTTKYMAVTQMEAIEARTAFPCFDEPDMKATFNITVVSQPTVVTLANMPLLSSEQRNDNWVAYTFEQSPIMSTYQVCIAVGDFIFVEAEWQNVTTYPIRIYARSQMADKLELAAKVAPLIQAWLEEETGIPYNLPKMDHIAYPSKAGAMENWGLITYGEDYLCVDKETSGASGIMTVVSIIAHELAHQWYGNLVTCKWWNDIWLNEGFATFYNYMPQAALGWPGSESQQADPRRGTQQFFEKDQLNTSDPIRKTIDTVWQADSSFSGSTYPKGGAMLRMLKGILSEDTLKSGFTRYLNKYSYSSAETDDLWTVLTEQAADDGITYPDGSALDIKSIMDAWLNQMGFPLLTVTRNGDGTASISSSRYLSPRGQSADTDSEYNYSWAIPITILTPDNSNDELVGQVADAWIPFGETSTDITPGNVDWFMINAKQFSFYRVQYDSALLSDIVNQLLDDKWAIPVESRAQLIDDTFSLARSLVIPLEQAMNTTQYLGTEMLYNPWGVALKHLLYIDTLVFKQLWRSNYLAYMVSLLYPVYNNLGWNYAEVESPLQQFLRRDVILQTCFYGNVECREEARSQYATYIVNPSVNSVLSNNLPTVLCVGVSEGSSTDWSTVFEQYRNRILSPIREERYAYFWIGVFVGHVLARETVDVHRAR